eukprot:Gregarina_sp_Poly_1__2831@NODE_178_length_11948_cov_356_078613_g158_i0_p3_GENE_NODE_178_length_11948_cov_356_078613_g158_i0NODE_178_length_11948_cov_356_078613_g158_i0_p3_ORF_typecomplete_len443_score34_94Aa_trans/PF01490_18/1_6e44_NODE_178_length_11948_cov_356_078613_g158_i0919810526
MRLEPAQIRELGTQLALSAVGPGLLTLPFGVSRAGLPLSAALLAFFMFLSAKVVLLLDEAKYSTKEQPTSYVKLTEFILGHRWKRAMECVVILNGLGVCISFMIFLGGFAPPALHSLFPNVNLVCFGRTPCLVFFSLVSIVLSSVKDFSALSWLNLVPVAGLLYTTIYLSLRVSLQIARGEIDLGSSMYSLVRHVPNYQTCLTPNIFLFTTMMQVNVLPIMSSFPDTGQQDIVKSLRYGHGSLLIFYLALGIVGYLASAGPTGHLSQNFTLDLPLTDLSVAFLRVVLVFTLLAIAPYQFVAIASAIVDLVKRLYHRKRFHKQDAELLLLENDALSSETESCSSNLEIAPRLEKHIILPQHSFKSRLVASTCLIGIAFSTALLTDKVATILSLTGGIGSTTLMCTAPFFIQRRLRPNKFICLLGISSVVGYVTTLMVFIDLLS